MGEVEERIDVDAEERILVKRWRFEQFIELGFTESDSATLADTHVDLSVVRRMIGNGCPIEIASRILL